MNVPISTNLRNGLIADAIVLIKPRITLLALITAIAGIYIAPVRPDFYLFFYALVGITLLVAGASALNMFLERDIDGFMERTKDRPLASQRMSPETGLAIGSVLIGVAIPLLIYQVNPLTGFLGLFSLFIYVLVYTPLKQKTSLSLLIGAIPGAAPPLLGWTAMTNRIALPGLILFGIVFFWQMPHFLAIGTFRREEYAKAGFKIFPLKQRPSSIKFQTLFYTVFMMLVSFSLVKTAYAGNLYFWAAFLLNSGFLLVVLWRIWEKEDHVWGKRVFFASLFYLTLLFCAIFLDGGLHEV